MQKLCPTFIRPICPKFAQMTFPMKANEVKTIVKRGPFNYDAETFLHRNWPIWCEKSHILKRFKMSKLPVVLASNFHSNALHMIFTAFKHVSHRHTYKLLPYCLCLKNGNHQIFVRYDTFITWFIICCFILINWAYINNFFMWKLYYFSGYILDLPILDNVRY